jgi:L-ascorbate metabolism protein UlaG (beta-lactamase superfamily)
MQRNPYYSGPISDHFDGTRFFIRGYSRDKTRADMWRWLTTRRRARWPLYWPSPYYDHPPARVTGDTIRVTMIGHASVLLQTQGLNVLIDPVWSERASPVGFAGPRRVNRPGVDLDQLPPLDAVLISHNHYDHMDVATLSKLARRHAPRFITPLGNDVILRRADRAIDAEAYDWGARVVLSGRVSIHLLPAFHWSARGWNDKRMALWCAFMIETAGGPIYHIADTGWGNGSLFSDIRERFGPPRLALIPIGAYEPRWFMQANHIDPEEAVRVFQLCGARRALGHHWGTFQLTDEQIDDPPHRLAAALDAAGLQREVFQPMRPGQSFTFED